MSKFTGAGLAVLLAVSAAAAQDPKLYSNPSLPSPEVLERLNLKMAWHVNVPMDGRRDGFASVQVNNGQLIAQTRSGVISAFDAETGKPLWSITAGKAYDTSYPPTFNSKSVLVVNGVHLASIDRKTGALQWQHRMLMAISAAPVADEYQIYMSGASGRAAAYQLPAPGFVGSGDPLGVGPGTVTRGDAFKESYGTGRGAEVSVAQREVRPEPLWGAETNRRLDYSPFMTRDALFYVTVKGDVFALGKYPLTGQGAEIYRFQLDRPPSAPPGFFEETAYVPTTDLQLYAVSMTSGKIRWRYSIGAEVTRTPFTTDADVYVTVERKGLVRLDRETGEPMWKLPFGKGTTTGVAEAERVMAVNNKFVYAADRAGRLLVLDRATGKQLSHYDAFRDFAFPIANEANDRLILAANNGLVVCLHDREYEKPLVNRTYNFASKVAPDRVKAVQEKLARKVSERGGGDAMPLGEVLDGFKKRYGLDVLASNRPFIDAGLQPVLDKKVTQPRVENLEISEVLKGILTQVGATFEVVGDVVVVLPAKKGPVEPGPKPPPDMNPNPMVPPADAALRDKLAIKVDTPANDKLPLGDMLTFFADRFDIKFEIDEKAFKAAGVEDVLKKDVVHPKANKTPFAKVLSDILAQVKGDYQVKGDTIVIVPKR
jgi:outer membrane protein assembly factor BamB